MAQRMGFPHAPIAVLVGAVLVACSSGGGASTSSEGVGAGGHVVGGACHVDADCQARCVGGDHYPGGMCTVSCRDDRDCPRGTECIDDQGGLCAISCSVNADCDGLGSGYRCDKTDRRGASGETSVCRRP